MTSPELTVSNVAKIAEMFPGVITESVDADGNPVSAVDFDLLRQELSGEVVDGPQERYQLDWPGKRAAAFTANAPIAKTLRPVVDRSVNFAGTQNIFIEGDNLDALKLLQESYLGKVKLVYIDPPYNTGSDFLYEDDFAQSTSEYLERSGQVDGGGARLVANPDSKGRFHSDWLDMIYPRLRLARNLLTEDGYIVVSIDDAEFAAMELLLDEVMGSDNKLAVLVWDRNRKNDARFFSVGHEYMLVYARDKATLTVNGTRLREPQQGIDEARELIKDLRNEHGDDWEAIQAAWRKWTSAFPADDERRKLGRFSKVGPRGPFRDDGNISWPGGGGPRYEVLHPVTGRPCKIPSRGWVFSSTARFDEMVASGRVVFGADETTQPRILSYLFESEGLVMGSVHYSYAQTAAVDFMQLMGGKVFDNPKNWKDLRRLIQYLTEPNDIVVDFFAGSGSTGHAVMDLNAATDSKRRFILVQLDEVPDPKSEAAKAGYATIADIARDRLRRVGSAIQDGEPSGASVTDVGFRSLAVDTTNMADVLRTPDDTDQQQLAGLEDSVKPGRTGEDLLFQVLLDWGLDLALPIETEQIEGRTVYVVDDGALVACFDDEVPTELVRALAKQEPLRAVFRDAGFASDDARINAEQIFKELSPATSVKAI